MKHFIALSCIFLSAISFSQDIKFNQVNLTGMNSNPALTGVNGERKIAVAYRNQWPSISGSIISNYVSYQDGSFNFGNFGVYYANTNYPNGAFNSNRLGLNYAKPIQLTENLTVTPGLNASLILDHINFEKLTFGDIRNPRTGEYFEPLDLNENTFSADFSGGLLVTWKNVFAGVSLNQWGSVGSTSIFNTYANIGMSFSNSENTLALIPEASLNTIDGFYSAAIKVSGRYKWAKLGAEYTDRSGLSIIAGAQLGQFDISLSTEYVFSKLSSSPRQSYELGLAYRFKEKEADNSRQIYTYSLF